MPMFGVPLVEGQLPQVVIDCCDWLVANALKNEGLWRVEGFKATIDDLQGRYDAGEKVEFSADTDAGTCTGLVIRWLQKIPGGLFNSKTVEQMLAAKTDTVALQSAIDEMAPAHRDAFRYLCHHWRRVTSEASTNKMTTANVAKCVFMATIVMDDPKEMMKMLQFETPLAAVLDSPDIFPVASAAVASQAQGSKAAASLSAASLALCDTLFARINSSGSGALSAAEVDVAVGGNENLSTLMSKVMDSNGNKTVEKDEWNSFFLRLQGAGGPECVDELVGLFNECLDEHGE